MFNTGAKSIRVVGGPAHYYDNYTTTVLYAERQFGASLNTIVLANDSLTDTVSVSFNGSVLEAELYPKESIELNVTAISSVWIRGAAGGGSVRTWGF